MSETRSTCFVGVIKWPYRTHLKEVFLYKITNYLQNLDQRVYRNDKNFINENKSMF